MCLKKLYCFMTASGITYHLEIRSISDDQLKTALKELEQNLLLIELPNRLDFDVGEHGGRLSGGQKQRLGLARALLYSPKILILDEPTSALDKRSEKAILDTLDDLRGSVTIIAISHQETFVNASDRNSYLTKENSVNKTWEKYESNILKRVYFMSARRDK